MEFLLVGFGGFLGAVARYLVYLGERRLPHHSFPLGTLAINLVGCVLAGILLALIERATPYHRHLVLAASMGFVSSFTTFSTFSVESLGLLRAGQVGAVSASIAANVVLGIMAVWAGHSLMTRSL